MHCQSNAMQCYVAMQFLCSVVRTMHRSFMYLARMFHRINISWLCMAGQKFTVGNRTQYIVQLLWTVSLTFIICVVVINRRRRCRGLGVSRPIKTGPPCTMTPPAKCQRTDWFQKPCSWSCSLFLCICSCIVNPVLSICRGTVVSIVSCRCTYCCLETSHGKITRHNS